jgi:hypothetical protein
VTIARRRKGFVLGREFAKPHWRDWDALEPQQRLAYEAYYEQRPEESLPVDLRSKGVPHPLQRAET